MIFATLKGRIQTKLLTYLILAAVASVFAGMYGMVYVWVFCIAVALGLVLETIWSFVFEYQPGYLTFILGAIEFIAILAVASVFQMPMAFADALLFYLTAWTIIQLFLVYMMPIIHTSWADDGLELW